MNFLHQFEIVLNKLQTHQIIPWSFSNKLLNYSFQRISLFTWFFCSLLFSLSIKTMPKSALCNNSILIFFFIIFSFRTKLLCFHFLFILLFYCLIGGCDSIYFIPECLQKYKCRKQNLNISTYYFFQFLFHLTPRTRAVLFSSLRWEGVTIT